MKVCSSILTGTAALSKLKDLAPIVVEGGTGRRDQRDPAEVARRVAAALRPRITERQAILVTQGDPLEATGISAITRAVADDLAGFIPRALVTLPALIDPEHAPNAPREGVILEVGYDALAARPLAGDLQRRCTPNRRPLSDTPRSRRRTPGRARERPLAPPFWGKKRELFAAPGGDEQGAIRNTAIRVAADSCEKVCSDEVHVALHTDSEIPGGRPAFLQ